MKLGAQFYSIRNMTTTPEDLRESFKAMRNIGYEIAQMSGICSIEPERLRSYSEEFCLPITCTHSSFDRLISDTDKLIREHIIYGCPTIGLGGMPEEYRDSLDGIREFIKVLKTPVEKINAAGLDFAYHNHAFEFDRVSGVLPYDVLIEEFPALNFILDTYWIKYAGYDYLGYIEKIGAGRLKNVHLKDMLTEPKGEICYCGEGVIDFAPVVALCDKLGIQNALVEQDNAPSSGDSFKQMKWSYNSIKHLFGR